MTRRLSNEVIIFCIDIVECRDVNNVVVCKDKVIYLVREDVVFSFYKSSSIDVIR